MRRIILNEFTVNDYLILLEEEGIVYLKHQNFEEYWIVYFREFNLENQSESYSHYLELFAEQYPTIKKNTSLVIVEEEGRKSDDEIVSIENDPYLFKKYYLSYNAENAEGLERLLSQEEGALVKVEELMVKPEAFSHLKEEAAGGVYHLLYTIAHKLPFLPVIVDHEEVMNTDLVLDAELQECLEWCLGLSDEAEVRKGAIEQFSREEV